MNDLAGMIIITLVFLAGAAFSAVLFRDNAMMYQKAIEQCEKDLPRNQYCEITAIVKEIKDE